jgi:TonB family protein
LQDGNNIIVSGFGGAVLHDKALMRKMRGPVLQKTEPGFFILVIFSIALHAGIILHVNRMNLAPKKAMSIEEIPDRLVRFIIEKPLPKNTPAGKPAAKTQDKLTDAAAQKPAAQPVAQSQNRTSPPLVSGENAALRQARVENKIRTVGVLGLLTGVGSTAAGPAVVDVLGADGTRKERNQDLELALLNQTGLIKTGSAGILNRKLVQSKEAPMSDRREEIDELLEMGNTATRDLVKTGGSIIIKPPESIEGAASSNTLRSEKSIGEIVARRRAGIMMTYDKYLRREPGLGGKITVRFTISAAGTVTRVIILENTTGSSAFEQELVRKIKFWKFEQVLEGDVTVTYPFLFNPS